MRQAGVQCPGLFSLIRDGDLMDFGSIRGQNAETSWNLMMGTSDKISEFQSLVTEVHACEKCQRMCHSAHVLNNSTGNLNAKLFFIGEAPGRLGADKTKIPFHGDTSGRNFEKLLAFARISRNDVFVTNAVLCNPKDENGNNAKPTISEMKNCQSFLRQEIELVDPKIIITLGGTALRALAAIKPHGLNLNRHVRTIHSWFDRLVIPLYHPSQRVMNRHRSISKQQSDYQYVAAQSAALRRSPSGIP